MTKIKIFVFIKCVFDNLYHDTYCVADETHPFVCLTVSAVN